MTKDKGFMSHDELTVKLGGINKNSIKWHFFRIEGILKLVNKLN